MEEGWPFASFRHEHRFEPIDDGTRMSDRIEFWTRCGPLAPLADLAASAYLRRLMAKRNATIRSRAETR